MLTTDLRAIGNKLYSFRKTAGKTQEELAEAASVSGRTYADIERGKTNMRVETLLKICAALNITPDDILTEEPEWLMIKYNSVLEELKSSPEDVKQTALDMIAVYLNSTK